MINGLGVLGWGVGGIEAEAAMLGQPMSMLIPQVVGFKLHGELPEGATATDLVLTVTEMLRKKGVVGKFVEFYGPGVSRLPLADRATIGNMSPEFGSTCAIFPIDARRCATWPSPGRPKELIDARRGLRQGAGPLARRGRRGADLLGHRRARPRRRRALARRPEAPAGPRAAARRQGRLPRGAGRPPRPTTPRRRSPTATTRRSPRPSRPPTRPPTARPATSRDPHEPAGARGRPRATVIAEHSETAADVTLDGETFKLDHGHVVIAAITSCTNTSNPSVMLGAGLLARNAVARGLTRQPWVKTSLAPGSKVVTEYLDRAGLTEPLEELGFNLVGYGCTTCIGNSGPLPDEISAAVGEHDLAVCSVLSGNRNFEGRINPDVKMNYLASPPLVVAYAIAGTMDIDLVDDPLGVDADGDEVYLKDIWPSTKEIAQTVEEAVQSDMFRKSYGEVFDGDERWNGLEVPDRRPLRVGRATRPTCASRRTSRACRPSRRRVEDVEGARVLAKLGDSVTTDHISPAGLDQGGRPRRAPTSRSTASRSATSTPTARAAATTR